MGRSLPPDQGREGMNRNGAREIRYLATSDEVAVVGYVEKNGTGTKKWGVGGRVAWTYLILLRASWLVVKDDDRVYAVYFLKRETWHCIQVSGRWKDREWTRCG